MNVHDSERLAGLLEQRGLRSRRRRPADADVVVVNTCSVRERAEDKLYTRLGEIREASAGRGTTPVIAVTGCVAQQEGRALLAPQHAHRRRRRHAGAQAAAGAGRSRDRVAPRADRHPPARRRVVPAGRGAARRTRFAPGSRSSKAATSSARSASCRTRAVTSGCGPWPTSSPRSAHAAETGHREVQLLGQIVNHYQAPDDARATLPVCSSACRRSRASSASASPARIRVT